jgi:hypothetical protein
MAAVLRSSSAATQSAQRQRDYVARNANRGTLGSCLRCREDELSSAADALLASGAFRIGLFVPEPRSPSCAKA